MRFLFRIGILGLVCSVALVFAVPTPGALAQGAGSPADSQYGGNPEEEDTLLGPPVTECPPSGVLPDGEQCAPTTSDLADDAADDSLDAADAVNNVGVPSASPSSANPSSTSAPSASAPSAGPSSVSTPSASPSSAAGVAPSVEDEPPPAPASSTPTSSTPTPSTPQDSSTPDGTTGPETWTGGFSEKVDKTESEAVKSETGEPSEREHGAKIATGKTGAEASYGEEGEKTTTGKTAIGSGDKTADGAEAEPRRSVSEGDKYGPRPVDTERVAADESKDGGFAALAVMGAASALLVGIVLTGRVFKAPG